MKKLTLLTILLLTPLLIITVHSQSKDSLQNKNDWKFAAGITLYTNNRYIQKDKFLERQPIELNIRYKFNKHHVLRFQFPFSLKVNMHGISMYEEPFLIMNENAKNEAYEIWKGMQADNFNFVRTNQLYYNLWGISLGYDYNLILGYNISIFGGFDLLYTYLKFYTDWIGIGFSKLDEENKTTLSDMEYITDTYHHNCFSIKPLLGCRYLFQKKLLIECSIGYGFAFSNKLNGTRTWQSYDSNETNVFPFWQKRNYKQIITQLSINYSF